MAQEKFFFKKAANVHPMFRTPDVALIFSMIWNSILVVSGTFDLLTNLVILAGFFLYGFAYIWTYPPEKKWANKIESNWLPGNSSYHYFIFTGMVGEHGIVQPNRSLIGLKLLLSAVPFLLKIL